MGAVTYVASLESKCGVKSSVRKLESFDERVHEDLPGVGQAGSEPSGARLLRASGGPRDSVPFVYRHTCNGEAGVEGPGGGGRVWRCSASAPAGGGHRGQLVDSRH